MSLPPISEPEPTETERPGGLSAAVTYSADLDDLKVRRVFPVGKALVAIVMAASLIAVSWMGLQIKTATPPPCGKRRMRPQSAHATRPKRHAGPSSPT